MIRVLFLRRQNVAMISFASSLFLSSRQWRGSSRIRSSGSFTKALASRHRCCSPLDRSVKKRFLSCPMPNMSIQKLLMDSCSSVGFPQMPAVSDSPPATIPIAGMCRRNALYISGLAYPMCLFMSQMLSPLPRFLSNRVMSQAYDCGLSAHIRLSRVLFPLPFSPHRAHFSPFRIFQSRRSRMVRPPYLILTFLRSATTDAL